MYIERPLSEYLSDLAAGKPAPGGGSAAALEAALGCSLLSMVLAYTISNKKYEPVKDRATEDLGKIKKLLAAASGLIDEDVKAYSGLSEAVKKKEGAEILDKLYKNACDVPCRISMVAGEAMAIARGLVEYGNRNLVTDTAIAALMLESAFFAAKFNAYINLKFISDDKYMKDVHDRLSGLEEKMPELKEEILHLAEEVISK